MYLRRIAARLTRSYLVRGTFSSQNYRRPMSHHDINHNENERVRFFAPAVLFTKDRTVM